MIISCHYWGENSVVRRGCRSLCWERVGPEKGYGRGGGDGGTMKYYIWCLIFIFRGYIHIHFPLFLITPSTLISSQQLNSICMQ